MWRPSEPRPKRSWPEPRRLLSERELADAWEQRAYMAHWLVDCCGRHLRVVFPGRRWGGPGPDFVGAVLAQMDGVLVRGDVEVHLRASSWAAHRHARDPAYARVVLHVVQEADAVVLAANGGHVPTVTLEPELGRGPPRAFGSSVPCVRDAAEVLQVVEAAGNERFRARAARFEGDLSVVDADQVLWRGVAEALGYRRNRQPFGQLADAVPWAQAATVVAERGPVGLAGLLLGVAGLLGEATLPEAHAWRALQRTQGWRAALQAQSWDRRQLRAANAPAQRCRGLAELAARWVAAERGLGPPVTVHCVATEESKRGLGLAEQALETVREAALVRHPRLWRFARAAPWIGRGRAQVVVINVLLPFSAAAGMHEAAELFQRLPGEPSNRIVRYMAQQLGAPAVRFRGARHQQGLVHLFKMTCASRLCEVCPARVSARRGRNNFAALDV